MAFTIKTGATSNIREDLKKQKEREAERPVGNTEFARWIPNKDKDGELVVRFLANPDNEGWIYFYQFFVPGKGGIVETEENSDHYRNELDLPASKRWYAPALDIVNNKVIVIELVNTLIEPIMNLADRWGGADKDLRTFDIALYKTGRNQDTKYFAEFAGGKDLDLSDREIPNLYETLKLKVDFQEGNLKKRDTDASDEIENEVIGKAETHDDPPFAPDTTPKVAVKRRPIKRKAA